MIQQNKATEEILEAVKLLSEQKRLVKLLQLEDNEYYLMPHKYYNKYGVEKSSLTCTLLETYHQLRLKDNDRL